MIALALAVLAAQVPCGVVDPCPTPTPSPSPEPTASPSPTPTPTTQVTIALRRTPRAARAGSLMTLRGRVSPRLGRNGRELVELVGTAPDYGGRQFPAQEIFLEDDGTFETALQPTVTTRYVVRAVEGSGLTGSSPARTVRAFAGTEADGAFNQSGRFFEAAVFVSGPRVLSFVDGSVSARPFARRAYLYAGTGRRLRRLGGARLRRDPDEVESFGLQNLYAPFRIRTTRLPRRRFRYIGCFPGRGGRGLVPAFSHCGARYFRLSGG